MNIKRFFWSWILLGSLAAALPSHAYAQSPQITSGLSWLSATQSQEGHWTGIETTDYHSTAAALTALSLLGNQNASYSNGLNWLNLQTVNDTHYFAERVSINGGAYSAEDLNAMLSYRQPDGGFGGFSEYFSNNRHTSLSLRALKSANYTDTTVINGAINYLTNNQNADGGWGFFPSTSSGQATGDTSNVYMTALVLDVLSQFKTTYNLQTPINNAVSYLLTSQNPDGGFGSSPSNVYETALSLISLIESGQGTALPLQNAINYLEISQSTDGSWNQDPYATALALRALVYVRPNLTILSSDISFSNPMPQVGTEVTLTANIRNTGLEAASNVIVRFYIGDPSAGGVQIGADQVIPSLAPNSSTQVSITQTFPTTGSKTIYVQVDPDNLISETSEADNKTSARLWVATAPDLAVFSEDIKPSTFTPASGTPFTIEYTIRNLGESAANGFDVAVYDGPSTGSGQAGGILLQTTHISGLNGTEVRTGTFGVTLTGDGAHTLYVVADSGNLVSESSKANNTANVTVTVGGEQTAADLSVTSADITLNPSRPSQGNSVAITACVRNQGMEAANNFLLEIYDGAPESGGVLINSQRVSSLPAAGELTITANWAITSGIHDLYVILDRSNNIVETDENNNKATARVMTDMVDVAMSATDLVLNPSHPVIGDAVALTMTIHNQGIKDTGAFNLVLYDGDPSAGSGQAQTNGGQGQAQPLQTFAIANILGDGSVTLTHTFTAEARTYRFYAIADNENTVVELYESNNQAIRSLTVKAPGETLGPDLVPIKIDTSAIATDPQMLTITGAVKVTLQNKGDDKITTPFSILVFDDVDNDGRYTEGVDTLLGTGTNTLTLWPEGANIINISLSGNVRFLNAPLYAMVDSSDGVMEQSEENNVIRSGSDCEVRPTNPIQPVVKWSKKFPPNSGIVSPPVVTNLTDDNGDGKIDYKDIPDILIGRGQDIYYHLDALRGDTGAIIFSVDERSYPIIPRFIATGDIDGDGLPEIIVARHGGEGLLAFEHNGTFKWENSAIARAWNQANYPKVTRMHENGIPVIADIDADGKLEIISSVTAVNLDGSIKWGKDISYGTGDGANSYIVSAVVADLDMDGKQDIIAGNTSYNNDGSIKWTNSFAADGFAVIGNIDQDPHPEVILYTCAVSGGRMYAIEHDGKTKWGPIYMQSLEPSNKYRLCGNKPLIADFDGDGKTEIGIKGQDKYFILDNNGNIKNTLSIPPMGNNSDTTPTVFDLNGDGIPEVMIKSDGYFRIFNGNSGKLLYEEKSGGYVNRFQSVIVADVDNDGQAEIVLASHGDYTGYDPSYVLDDTVRVYGSKTKDWVGSRRIWNQATYHVTNINDDGTIPQHEAPSWLLNNSYMCQARVGESPNPYLTSNLTASYLRAAQDSSTINLTVRIGNGGAKEVAAGVSVKFYDGPSTGSTSSPQAGSGQALATDMAIGTAATTKALRPGDYQDVTLNASGISDGLHRIYAVVDGDNSVSECREDDNLAQADVSVVSGLPDLKIGSEDIMLPVAPYYEGNLVPVTLTVKNLGSLSASNVSVRLYNGNPYAGGVQVGTQVIQGVPAGSSANVRFTYDTLGKSGTNILYIAVDPDNAIPEASETNNLAVIAIEVQAPALPNLTVTPENILIAPSSPREGEKTTILATVVNRGAATGNIPVGIYMGDPASGGTLISGQTIYPILGLGHSSTVTATLDTTGLAGQPNIYIKIDPANTIAESSKDDNTASKTLFIQSAGITTSLTLDKTSYQVNETVTAAVTVTNATSTARLLTADCIVIDSAGNKIAAIIKAEPVTVGPNGTATITRSWNTGTTLNGAYTVMAEFSEGGIIVSRKSLTFSIAPDKRTEAKVTANKIQYNPRETVTLTPVVSSISQNYIFENLTAELKITSPNGAVIFSEIRNIMTLMPGAAFTFNVNCNAGANPRGTYTASLRVLFGQSLINTASTTFEILGTSKTGGGLAGTLIATPSPVYQGKDETIKYTVTNNGNEVIRNLDIKVLIVDPETGEMKAEVSGQMTDLRQWQTITNTVTAATGALAPKTYLAILQAITSTMSGPKTLASTTFEVLPALEIKQTIPDYGRILVWINDKCEKDSKQDAESSKQKTKDSKQYAVSSKQKEKQKTEDRSQNTEEDDDDKDEEHKECIRQDLVERALQEIGITYYIVKDKKDFEKELRNNYYTDYLILGDHNPLEDHYGEELRERVFSGKGIITSPWIGEDEDEDEYLFGIEAEGKLKERDNAVEFTESAIFKTQAFISSGRAVKIDEYNPANVLAWIDKDGEQLTVNSERKDKEHNNKESEEIRAKKYPAVIKNEYGNGKALFFAFDLGLSAREENYAQFVEIHRSSLNYVHRPIDITAFHPYDLAPIRIELKSLGAEFDLKITETYPDEIKLTDQSTGQWITENPWTKEFHLAANERKAISLFALTPDVRGTYNLTTDISYLENSSWKPYQTLSTEIAVEKDAHTLINDILYKLDTLYPATNKEREEVEEAKREIEKIRDRVINTKEDLDKNIHDIIEAIEAVMEVTTVDTKDVRLDMDRLLGIYGEWWYLG